jgi:acetyltransferase EpsM
MVVYGASGHAKVVIELLEVNNIDYIVIWDDTDKPAVWQYVVKKPAPNDLEMDARMVIGIGNNNTRKNIAERYIGKARFTAVVHPHTIISPRTQIGEGTVIMAGAVINTDTHIGQHCIINTCASIDHDCEIEDYVHISPNTTLCGNVTVGEGTHVGAGSVVIQGIRIGKWSTIGAGSVVIRDVPDYATVVGNPGRIIKG